MIRSVVVCGVGVRESPQMDWVEGDDGGGMG